MTVRLSNEHQLPDSSNYSQYAGNQSNATSVLSPASQLEMNTFEREIRTVDIEQNIPSDNLRGTEQRCPSSGQQNLPVNPTESGIAGININSRQAIMTRDDHQTINNDWHSVQT